MGTEGRTEGSSAGASGSRKIIHIDMDAFYASVEQRDNPELRGKPLAVGGSRERGVVAAASYEARQFGVHSAMASITAKRKCSDLIFVQPRFEAYKAISLQIREIFAAYTPVIEPLSLDEAYHDVTENRKGIARQPRSRKKSGQGSAPKPSSQLRPASPTTNRREACFGSPQTGRAFRHHSQNGAGICRGPAGQEVSRHRPGTAAKVARTRDRDRGRPSGADPGFPAATFRESGRLLLLGCAQHRRAARPCRPDTKSVGAENTFPPIYSPTRPPAMRFE